MKLPGWLARLGGSGRRAAVATSPPAGAVRRVPIGGGTATVELPTDFGTELDPEGTTVAFPPDLPVTLRLSVITFTTPDGRPGAGIDHVRRNAREAGVEVTESGGNAVMMTTEDSQEDGVPLLVHYWAVGGDDAIALVSATVPRAEAADARVVALIGRVPEIVASLEFTDRVELMETPQGPITTRVSTVEPKPQTVRPFGEADRAWLAASLRQAEALAVRYDAPAAAASLSPAVLDRVFARWLGDVACDRPDGGVVAAAAGAALGEHLVRAAGMEWAVVTDDAGTARAVRHAATHVMAFPQESVLKRIERGEADFVDNIARAVVHQIEISSAPQ